MDTSKTIQKPNQKYLNATFYLSLILIAVLNLFSYLYEDLQEIKAPMSHIKDGSLNYLYTPTNKYNDFIDFKNFIKGKDISRFFYLGYDQDLSCTEFQINLLYSIYPLIPERFTILESSHVELNSKEILISDKKIEFIDEDIEENYFTNYFVYYKK